MAAALDQFPQSARTLVFSGCDRRDIDLVDMGQTAGAAFDRVILYTDWGHNGRDDGELNALFRQGLNQASRMSELLETATEREAIDLALADIGPGKLVVLGVETIEESLRYVQQRLQ
jgi:cyanophycin synthetase